jgi:hypothetical protein
MFQTMKREDDAMRTVRLGLSERVWRILRVRILQATNPPESRKTMTDAPSASQHPTPAAPSISRLHADAWSAWNTSYHAPMPDAYRIVSLALYQQALHEAIETLFTRLDMQNAQLDALLPSHG